MTDKIRILSLDGGGVRAIISITLLKAIEDAAGRQITELFDYITSTSTGAIIGIGYTIPDDIGNPKYNTDYILKNTNDIVQRAFPQDWWSWIKNYFGIFNSKYDRDGIDEVFKDFIGDTKLSETVLPISMNTFNLENNSAITLSTLSACSNVTQDLFIRDALGMTTAAPTFFDPKIISEKHYIDGGVFANNPIISGYADLKSHYPNIPPDNVIVVSIGTGAINYNNTYSNNDNFGIWQWAVGQNDIINIALSAPALSDEVEASQIFQHYHRLQPIIPSELSALDNPANIPALQKLAQEYVAQNPDLIKAIVDELTADESTHRLKFDCPNAKNYSIHSNVMSIAHDDIAHDEINNNTGDINMKNENTTWSSNLYAVAKYSALTMASFGFGYIALPHLISYASSIAYAALTTLPSSGVAVSGLTTLSEFAIKNPFTVLQWSAIGYKLANGQSLPFIGEQESAKSHRNDSDECQHHDENECLHAADLMTDTEMTEL